jgi:mono/diheme cytochrome c family protein
MRVCILFVFILIASCQQPYKQGERIYQTQCANCHMSDGSGLNDLIPPLTKMSILDLGDELTCIIINGKEENDLLTMPPQKGLTEAELNNLLNYIRYTYTPSAPALKISELRDQMESCD